MKVVFDSSIFVRVALNPNGMAADLLQRIYDDHVLIVSHPLLVELLTVIRRPHLAKLHGLDEFGTRQFIRAIYRIATIVPVPEPMPRVIPHDPKDDAVFLTAVSGHADVLVTRDADFYDAPVPNLAAQLGFRILSDDDLLKELRAKGQ